jgi:hypothetical protein
MEELSRKELSAVLRLQKIKEEANSWTTGIFVSLWVLVQLFLPLGSFSVLM